MKVLSILGSPRKKGVTASLVHTFNSMAQELGATVSSYHLNDLSFKDCQGCGACKATSETCVLKDDLIPVLEEMQTADITVFSTPVYYWDVTGLFKSFFDRTWSFVKPDYQTNPDPSRLKKGKKALLITSQADIEAKHGDVAQKYSGFLKMYGYDTHILRAFGIADAAQADIRPFMELAGQKARQLIV